MATTSEDFALEDPPVEIIGNVIEICSDEVAVAAVFSNPLILGIIMESLSNEELLNFRNISKTFDNECVRTLLKRGYGKWVQRTSCSKVVELLEESRHPTLLIGKVFITKLNFYLYPKFEKVVIANSEHIRHLKLQYYFDEELISILNACSKIVELIIYGDLNFDNTAKDKHQEWIQKMEFNFKNLSRLEFRVMNYRHVLAHQSRRDLTNYLFNEIICATEKLIVLEFRSWQLSSLVKLFEFEEEEDSELVKKMGSLKTLKVSQDRYAEEDIDESLMVNEDELLLKLLSMLGKSIENLYLCWYSWERFATESWPKFPNLTTLSLEEKGGYDEVPYMENLPSRIQTPKLSLLLIGNSDGSLEKAVDIKGYWKFELDYEMEGFRDCQPSRKENLGTLTAMVWAYGEESELWMDETLYLLEDLEVQSLFVNLRNYNQDQDTNPNDRFLVKCFFGFPSLDRLSVRNENGPDVDFRTVYF